MTTPINTRTAAGARQRREELMVEGRALADRNGDLAGDDLERFEEIEAELEDLAKIERMARGLADGSLGVERGDGAPQVMTRTDPWSGDLTRLRHEPDVRQRAATAAERMELGTDAQRQAATELVERSGPDVAEHVVLTAQPA